MEASGINSPRYESDWWPEHLDAEDPEDLRRCLPMAKAIIIVPPPRVELICHIEKDL